MTEQEILESIETILYNAAHTNKLQGMRFYAVDRKGTTFFNKFYNNTIILLLALYQKLPSEKDKELLLNNLNPKPTVPFLSAITGKHTQKTYPLVSRHRDFVFVFLIKINKIDMAFQMITDNIAISSIKNDLLQALFEILEIEPNTFSDKQLNHIIEMVDIFQSFISDFRGYIQDKKISVNGKSFILAYDAKKISNYKASDQNEIPTCLRLLMSIRDKVYKIKQDRLSSILLEGVNLEINQDQEQLENMIREFGITPKLKDTIAKINEKLYDAKDQFDYKSCMDLIRAFLNELCVAIALEIEKRTSISPTMPIEEDKKMGRAMDYFRDNRIKFLEDKEKELLASFNSYLSYRGVHRLQSGMEDARISKNMAIEIGLFLIKRLDKYVTDLKK